MAARRSRRRRRRGSRTVHSRSRARDQALAGRVRHRRERRARRRSHRRRLSGDITAHKRRPPRHDSCSPLVVPAILDALHEPDHRELLEVAIVGSTGNPSPLDDFRPPRRSSATKSVFYIVEDRLLSINRRMVREAGERGMTILRVLSQALRRYSPIQIQHRVSCCHRRFRRFRRYPHRFRRVAPLFPASRVRGVEDQLHGKREEDQTHTLHCFRRLARNSGGCSARRTLDKKRLSREHEY